MNLLGIEGGGTKTSVLLVDSELQTILAELQAAPGNLHLLAGGALDEHLASIRERLPAPPDRIGVGMAGVRSEGDRDRLA